MIWENEKDNARFEVTPENVAALTNKNPRLRMLPEETREAITLAATDALEDLGGYDREADQIWTDRGTARRVVYHMGNAYTAGVRAAYDAMREAASAIL